MKPIRAAGRRETRNTHDLKDPNVSTFLKGSHTSKKPVLAASFKPRIPQVVHVTNVIKTKEKIFFSDAQNVKEFISSNLNFKKC